MKNIIFILGLTLYLISGSAYAEYSATACYDMGFNAAAKAFNAGDRSAFTPVYGMSPAMMEKSPCCQNGMDKGCMAYNAAFQTVQQHGPNKNTLEYEDKLLLFKQMDTGFFGF